MRLRHKRRLRRLVRCDWHAYLHLRRRPRFMTRQERAWQRFAPFRRIHARSVLARWLCTPEGIRAALGGDAHLAVAQAIVLTRRLDQAFPGGYWAHAQAMHERATRCP